MKDLTELELLHISTIKEFLTVLDAYYIKYGKWAIINNISCNDDDSIGEIEVKITSLNTFNLRFLHSKCVQLLVSSNEAEMYLTSKGEMYFKVYPTSSYDLPIKLVLITEC